MKSAGNKEKNSFMELDLKKYEAEGVDISMIRSQLETPPSVRLQNNMKMLDLIEQAQKNRARMAGR